ncbi:hypothetical protein C475_08962 [Halosimplex carlsbadense 2-9-1]|uniref:Uncharacterized protein n=1 Tax=Halosimplex carlsbadense 2-9-1 TaxID=797114 RepID=M0CXF0_9EURY|nr:hypothetical protein [Halosimplex carlsbadense]ELZ26544.1 hypothetical protein C475_08962 [Halosimplex carlsbadense 2-9-1]
MAQLQLIATPELPYNQLIVETEDGPSHQYTYRLRAVRDVEDGYAPIDDPTPAVRRAVRESDYQYVPRDDVTECRILPDGDRQPVAAYYRDDRPRNIVEPVDRPEDELGDIAADIANVDAHAIHVLNHHYLPEQGIVTVWFTPIRIVDDANAKKSDGRYRVEIPAEVAV